MKIKQVMTLNPTLIPGKTTVEKVAKLMSEKDIGFIPVGEQDKLLGVITDRDITIRSIGKGKPLTTTVEEILTKNIFNCFEDDEVSVAAKLMQDKQVRRLVVLNKQKKLVGIVTLRDIVGKNGGQQLSPEILNYVCKAA